MNQDDIIRMAREAGIAVEAPSWGYTESYHFAGFEKHFKRFADLAFAAGAAAEREECARVAETAADFLQNSTFDGVAEAIRARGQQ